MRTVTVPSGDIAYERTIGLARSGDVEVHNSGHLHVHRLGENGIYYSVFGIAAASLALNGEAGDVSVQNEGAVRVRLRDRPGPAYTGPYLRAGILAVSSGNYAGTAGDVEVVNSGLVKTRGRNLDGIVVDGETTSVLIARGGKVRARGPDADGIVTSVGTNAYYSGVPVSPTQGRNTVIVEGGATVLSRQGVGILDPDTNLYSFDSNPFDPTDDRRLISLVQDRTNVQQRLTRQPIRIHATTGSSRQETK